jgi:hypothetical protein
MAASVRWEQPNTNIRIPRVPLVAGLEGERRVDDVTINIVDAHPLTPGVKGGLNALGTVISVP